MAKTANRPTKNVAGKVDRISSLPDELLSQILFSLPTKSALRTTALSQRWRNLWASVNSLRLDEREVNQKSNFMDTVDKILVKRDTNISIEKFSLNCYINPSEELHRFHHWISEVIKHYVQHLDLRINSEWERFELPSEVFTCKTLVTLKVSARIVLNLVRPDFAICLPNLKVLHLVYVDYVNDESVTALLSGCPALEELYIWRKLNDGVNTFNICSDKLKRFTLGYYDKYESDLNTHMVRVSAPSLEYLHLENEYSEDIVLNDLSSLIEAKLTMSVPRLNLPVPRDFNGIKFTDLLRMISNVKHLELYGGTIASLAVVNYYDLPMLHNLTYLELAIDSRVSRLLFQLLDCAPLLKNLILDMGIWCGKISPRWVLPQLSDFPICLFSSLEYVEIRKWSGKVDIRDLFKFLLKYGHVLKKIKAHHYALLKKSDLINELHMFPKASKACQIQLVRCKRD